MDQYSITDSAPKRAIQHSWSADRHSPSADWHKFEARPKDPLIEIKLIFFDFLEIRTRSNSYLIIQLIFQSIPTSINSGCLSKFRTLSDPPSPSSFWQFSLEFSIPLRIFNSPYVKDILKAFSLEISFL